MERNSQSFMQYMKSRQKLMEGSMGPSNMKRRQKGYRETAVHRISELNKHIEQIDVQTKLFKEQSKRQISSMMNISEN